MNFALLVAAGTSRRFGKDKLFELIAGKPVIFHALRFLQHSPHVDKIYIAVHRRNMKKIAYLITQWHFAKVTRAFIGGTTRFHSVRKLFSILKPPFRQSDRLIIHNAANPLATHEELECCFRKLKGKSRGVAVGRRVEHTIKETGRNIMHHDGIKVISTIPRENLYEVETPQVVYINDFYKALGTVGNERTDFTDDLAVLEAVGLETAIVEASPLNRKITCEYDLEALRAYAGDSPKEFSVGIGEDGHRFANAQYKSQNEVSQHLVLAGLAFKNLPPMQAESDGDVVLHALCNAISSGLGELSLGTYATAMCSRGIKDSREYLCFMMKKMKRRHLTLRHCALSIEALRPQIDQHASVIKRSLATLLDIKVERIGITATTVSSLSTYGRGDGIRCTAVVFLANTDV